MGKTGRRRKSSIDKKHIRPIVGVDVANQNVDLITRKVDQSEMTKSRFHPEYDALFNGRFGHYLKTKT